MGRRHVLGGDNGWAFRDSAVGARQRLPVERVDVLGGGGGRTSQVLKWARGRGGDPNINEPCPWDVSTCASAAEGGHLDILKWLRENDCPWDLDTLMSAIGQVGLRGPHRGERHLELISWAKANGLP